MARVFGYHRPDGTHLMEFCREKDCPAPGDPAHRASHIKMVWGDHEPDGTPTHQDIFRECLLLGREAVERERMEREAPVEISEG